MKSFVALLALVALAAADISEVLRNEKQATILRQDGNVLPDQFDYNYETSNGISGQAQGVLKKISPEEIALEVQGSNAYKGPNNEVFQVTYIANENGYQPQGAHLPTTPAPLPIPDYILRAIEYIKAHPPKAEKNYQ